MNQGKTKLIVSFLVVPIVLYVVFVLVPYLSAMVFAFTKWSGLSSNITFNGFNNFIKLYNDSNFWNALSHNGIALVVLPIVIISMALFFAFLFTQGIRFGRFFRISFFFPQVMSTVIVAVLWSFIFHPSLGVLSGFFRLLGVQSLANFPWLGDSRTVFTAVLTVTIWQALGFYMVLFISGMQGIPQEYYEVAKIDGANSWAMFWNVTLPLLWDTLRTAIIFLAAGAMNLFESVTVMTNGSGGPDRGADVLSTYLYQTAFTRSQFGYATAMGLVLLLLVLAFSIASLRFTARESLEY